MPEWLKGADCKSAAFLLRWFESNPAQYKVWYNYHKPVILLIIEKMLIKNKKIKKNRKLRNFGILNKFLNGVLITKINPTKLLIKNLGYLIIFFQKLSIDKF